MPISPLTPAYVPTNVITGQASMFLQFPWSSAAPQTAPDVVAVPIGTAWGGLWIPAGASDSGVELDFVRKTVSIMIEEQQTPVDILSDSTDIHVNITLAEDTLQTWMWAMGGGTITVTSQTQQLVVPSIMQKFAVGFEGSNQYGFPRRVVMQPCVSIGNAKVAFRRAKNARTWATSFNYLGTLENMFIKERTS